MKEISLETQKLIKSHNIELEGLSNKWVKKLIAKLKRK